MNSFLRLIFVTSFLCASHATAIKAQGGTPKDTAEIASAVANYLSLHYDGTIAVDSALTCPNGKACVENADFSAETTKGKKSSFHKHVRSAGGPRLRVIPLSRAANCQKDDSEDCKLVVDHYVQIFEPIISGDQAKVPLFVSGSTRTNKADRVYTVPQTLIVGKSNGVWRVVSAQSSTQHGAQ
jgi:hypothetical protein